MGFVSTAARMLLGLSPFEGERRLIIPNQIRAPLTLSRAQAAGVEATAYVDVRYPLIRPAELLAPLTLERAQAAGVQSTGDV
jgi:hypothetical protein